MKYYIKIALQHFAMGIIIPISIIWKLQNGLSIPEAVLTESIVLFATAFADLPAGLIANYINNKRSLILGGLFHFIGMILLAIGGSFMIFVIAALCTGVAWAFVSGADEAYIHDDFIEEKDEYKKVFATANMVDESFTIIGMITSSVLLLLNVPMQYLFVVAAVFLLIHLIYTELVLPASQKFPLTHPSQVSKMFSARILKNREVRAIIPLMIAFAIIYEAGRPLWQPQMQNIGINVASFGVIFALLKLASLGGSFMARIKDFEYKDLAIVLSIMVISLLVFGSNFVASSLVALTLYLFTENYFRVFMSSELNKLVTKNRAAVLSFSSVIRNLVGAVLILGAGVLSSETIFLAILGLVVIKLPAIVYVLKSSRTLR